MHYRPRGGGGEFRKCPLLHLHNTLLTTWALYWSEKKQNSTKHSASALKHADQGTQCFVGSSNVDPTRNLVPELRLTTVYPGKSAPWRSPFRQRNPDRSINSTFSENCTLIGQKLCSVAQYSPQAHTFTLAHLNTCST